MSPAQVVWAVSLIVAVTMLPVGVVRMVIYRSGDTDHTRGLRNVALFAVGTGLVALVVCIAMTVWFVASGQRPL